MNIWPTQPKALQNEQPSDGAPIPAPERKTGKVKPIPDDALILIPLRNSVLFPGTIAPLAIGRASSVAALQEAARTDSRIGFLLQRERDKNEVGPIDLYWVGSVGEILRHVAVPEAAHHLVVQGQTRFCVREFLEGWPFLVARVAMIESAEQDGPEIEARFMQLKEQAVEAIHLLPNAPEELASVVQAVTSPGLLADMVANLLDITNEQKQEVLESFDLRRRLDLVLAHLAERVS
ncbi:MAG: LON peptidase substrate-binding domain-containing protein, partial [Gemmatimonadota bacterium]